MPPLPQLAARVMPAVASALPVGFITVDDTSRRSEAPGQGEVAIVVCGRTSEKDEKRASDDSTSDGGDMKACRRDRTRLLCTIVAASSGLNR